MLFPHGLLQGRLVEQEAMPSFLIKVLPNLTIVKWPKLKILAERPLPKILAEAERPVPQELAEASAENTSGG